jgi:hypothetical protein
MAREQSLLDERSGRSLASSSLALDSAVSSDSLLSTHYTVPEVILTSIETSHDLRVKSRVKLAGKAGPRYTSGYYIM